MADDEPVLCRTLEEAHEAGRQRIRDMGLRMTQRQMERCWVLLRPYADQLLAARTDTAPHDAA